MRESFGGVAALREGLFRLEASSAHALCGGSDAGKFTFLKIVVGIEPRDGGTLRLDGRDVRFASPCEALAAGIAIVEQELSPVPAMTVAEDVFLGRESACALGRVDFRAMNAAASDPLTRPWRRSLCLAGRLRDVRPGTQGRRPLSARASRNQPASSPRPAKSHSALDGVPRRARTPVQSLTWPALGKSGWARHPHR